MQTSWIGTTEKEPMYESLSFTDWVDEMETIGKNDLVAVVKREARAFSSIFVTSVKERLSSTWNHIQCLELIDPLGPDLITYATPAVWEALRDLCDRRDINFERCRDQILSMRAQAPDLDVTAKALIRSDLCAYLRDRRQGFVTTSDDSPTAEYDDLCATIFSILLTSAFVESLFLEDDLQSTQNAQSNERRYHVVNSTCTRCRTPGPSKKFDRRINVESHGSAMHQRQIDNEQKYWCSGVRCFRRRSISR